MNHYDLLDTWLAEPHKFGYILGFTKLEPIHDLWIQEFIRAGNNEVRVLQAHRGSYKTTCGLVGLTLLFMLNPNIRVQIVRKSDTMARKLTAAMEQIFELDIVRAWMYAEHGVSTLKTGKWSLGAMVLSIRTKISTVPSLAAAGIGTAQAGDHYDFIWMDDIVTPEDRYSAAERERTKGYFFETENIIEPDGVRMVTGTLWHPQDVWTVILPLVSRQPLIYPIGTVPIKEVTPEWVARKKASLPKSLWAANYELKHVKDVDKEFLEPIEGSPTEAISKYWYTDPAFGGKDCTATWEGGTDGEFIYLTWASMYRKSIAEKYDEYESQFWARDVTKVFYEKNGAQRLIGPELDRRNIPNEGVNNVPNKFARITASLKPVWHKLRFHPDLIASLYKVVDVSEETPPNPMLELLEYNIDAEHDDSPDACAGLVSCVHEQSGTTEDDLLDIQNMLR